jgi:hypothetical protein
MEAYTENNGVVAVVNSALSLAQARDFYHVWHVSSSKIVGLSRIVPNYDRNQ